MVLTRRDFTKAVGIGALSAGIGVTTMGVSCDTVFQDIEAYVPIGLAAFDEILTLINPALGVTLAPIIQAVKSTFADLGAIITQYQNAPAADKATLVGKISTAINAVITELNKFWSDAGLPDGGLASTIAGVLQIILSTLAAFLPLIGGTVAATVVALKKTIPLVPRTKKQLAVKQVKADINGVFVKYGYANHIY